MIFNEEYEKTNAFFDTVADYNTIKVLYEVVSYDALRFYINGLDTTVINTESDKDIAEYQFTYFKNHRRRELSASAAQYLHYKARPFADHEFLQFMSASKLSEYMRLACHDINVPPTISMSTKRLLNEYENIVNEFGVPFVLKEIKSDRGNFNYLITKEADFKKMLDLALPDHIYCAQKYIPNDGFYRINVMARQIGMAVWRSTAEHKDPLKSHLNKPKGGANAVHVPLKDVPAEAQNVALRAADCMNRQVCGVDLIQDNQTGEWYVLEANNDPQIRSGSFVDAKAEMVAKYFERELNQ